MLSLKFIHLLCWVYWLGGDLGTFYASRFVADSTLSPAARATAAKIMMGTDIVPRLCLPLMLTTGLHLASLSGSLSITTPLLWALWVVCIVWLSAVWAIHHGSANSGLGWVIQLDFAFRILLSAGLSAVAFAGLLGYLEDLVPWLALKLLCFSGAVACGLAIRVELRDFGVAFAHLVQQGPDDAGNKVIHQSIARCIPYVIAIWLLLLLSAATGLHWLQL